jgi:uncharacterized protein (TIGR03083 family)
MAIDSPYRLPGQAYLQAIDDESRRFVKALAEADPDGVVPSCPGWSAADLLFHLAEVQWFWGQLVRRRAPDPSVVTELDFPRPGSYADLLDLARRCSAELVSALAAADESEPTWTWLDSDRTTGFIRRRQAHEALIHRVDAELAAGLSAAPLDSALATDGVDEALQIMFGGIPEWASYTRTHGPVLVRTTDTDARWLTDVGTQSGVEPESGKQQVDMPTLAIRDDDASPVAHVSADAATLDRWLWGRAPISAVQTSGDQQALSAMTAVTATGID